MPDYKELIDDETWDFIKETDKYYPPDAVTRSIEEQRTVYNTMCRAFHHGYPEGLQADDTTHGSVATRTYTPSNLSARSSSDLAPPASDLIIVYFHGGGFVVGGLESHDDVCAELAEKTGLTLVSVDYRLAPEHIHPASFDDCLAATKAIFEEYDCPLILCGDSAGGYLGAAVSHTCRQKKVTIKGQILIYPALGTSKETPSCIEHANAPMLTRDDMEFYQNIRAGNNAPQDDPTFAPLNDNDFSALPHTICFAAQCDPLASDCQLYCQRIIEAGGTARSHSETGLTHGYLRARHTVKRAAQAFENIVKAISEIAGS